MDVKLNDKGTLVREVNSGYFRPLYCAFKSADCSIRCAALSLSKPVLDKNGARYFTCSRMSCETWIIGKQKDSDVLDEVEINVD